MFAGCAIIPEQPSFDSRLIMPAGQPVSAALPGLLGRNETPADLSRMPWQQLPDSCIAAEAAKSAVTKDERDACITDLVNEINAAYYAYEITINHRIAIVNTTSDVGGAILSAAGGALADKTTKTALTAVGGVVHSFQSDFNKDVLYQDTMTMLVHQMQADRAKLMAQIRVNMQHPVEQYPLDQAMSDLNDYLHAGTLVDALSNLTQNTSDTASKCEAADSATKNAVVAKAAKIVAPSSSATAAATTTSDQCNAILEGVYSYDDLGKQLEGYWTKDGGKTFDAAAYKRLMTCLSQNNIAGGLTYLINAGTDVDRAKVIGCYLATQTKPPA